MGMIDLSVLLIDLVDSARLWEFNSDEYATVVGLYEQIVRDGVEAAQGRIVKPRGEGESLFIVFPTVLQALRCGVEVLKALQCTLLKSYPSVKPRLAVHCGEVHARDGDYFGSVINRCARMRGACAGGQFVASGSVVARIPNGMGNHIVLRSLGLCALRDFGVEEIWQVCAEGIEQHFEPVQGAIAHNRTNLPQSTSSFVGRTEEIDCLRSCILTNRLVTILGSGGTGKTSLALKVCSGLISAFDDGVWYAELASINNPNLVVLTVMKSLAVPEDGGLQPDFALADSIGPRSLLLVWDNCERVSTECARLAALLLSRCPNLKILATSREVLQVAGEDVFRLAGLQLPPAHDVYQLTSSPPESVTLFVERAAQVQPDYALQRDNYSPIVEICRRLDGIPLAIELAAARIRTMSARQIAERLGDQLRLLSGGNAGTLPHHRTLRSTIEWSYDLLNENERQFLCILSLFAASWEPEAVHALFEVDGTKPGEIDTLLASLADKSMLTFSAHEYRYSMLESVRHYASELLLASLEPTAILALQWRLVRYYADRAEIHLQMLTDHRQVDALRWLDAEVDNYRALISFALKSAENSEQGILILTMYRIMARWLNIRGFYREGVKLGQEVTNLQACTSDSAERGDALFLHGVLLDSVCEYTASMKMQLECLALSERIGDKFVQCNALVGLGGSISRKGDLDTAEYYLNQAVTLMTEMGATRMLAYARIGLLRLQYSRNRNLDTVDDLKSALAILEEFGDLRGQAIVAMELGGILEDRGLIEEPMFYYQKSVSLFQLLKHAQGMVNCHRILGDLEWQRGNITGVRTHFGECFRGCRNNGDWASLVFALEVRAEQELKCEGYEAAAKLYGAARQFRADLVLPATPEEIRLRAGNIAVLEKALGRANLQTQLLLGASLSLDAAIRLALSDVSAPVAAQRNASGTSF